MRMVDAVEEWFQERQSQWLYAQLERVETDPARRVLFGELGGAAGRQAMLWERRIAADDQRIPAFQPTLRARFAVHLARRLGTARIKPVLAALKVRGLSVDVSQNLIAGHRMPTRVDEVGARHRAVKGGTLRATVFGANDGLISNAGLILGVAGAGADARTVLLSGVAGLLAGSLSMAAGEYVSVRSQRELVEGQLALERAELAEYPEEETAEMALIYAARGMSREQAQAMAAAVMSDHERALDTLAREELGVDPSSLDSPWRAALASLFSFAAGAAIPLFPYLPPLGLSKFAAQGWTVGATLAALFFVGAAISLFTGRSALGTGLRMMSIGGLAGGVTWLVGHALGVAIG